MSAKRSFSFLSPLTKLVKFFQRSRDKWKEKCKTAKRQNKSLKLCLAKMKESRDRWKGRAMAGDDGDPPERSKRESTSRRAGTSPRAICPR
jgi:hypothetical protein